METTIVTAQLKKFGPLSIMVDDGDRLCSLPVRQIQNWDEIRDAEPGDAVDVEIPEWLAIKENLV